MVCAISGDFVQRGEAAMYSKFARAEAACLSGADLVVELPLPWALSSAESFAAGAVGLLASLGATHLSVGSESGKLDELAELAGALRDEDIYNEVKILQNVDGSLSFARARQLALEKRLGEKAGLLETPNNILAVEYLKAIDGLGLSMKALTVQRLGSAHDAHSDLPVRSASQLRAMLREGDARGCFVPDIAGAVYTRERQQGRELSHAAAMELALLSRLRMLGKTAFEETPDASGGLGERIYQAVQQASGLDELYALAKTKRYAMSRVRRVTMCAALGISKGMNEGNVPYARILAANDSGCALLRQLSDSAAVPLITKPAHVKALSPKAANLFAVGAKAHDLFSLCYSSKDERKPGEDWRHTPFIVKNR